MFGFIKKRLSDITDMVPGEVVLDEDRLDKLIYDFEITLLESDVAFEVCNRLKEDLKERLQGRKFKRAELKNAMKESLKAGILEIFSPKQKNLVEIIRENHESLTLSYL